MKILFIIPDYGSFDNFLSELAINLLEQGWEVEVICALKKIIPRGDKFRYKELGILFHFTDFVRGFNPFKHLKASRNIHRLIDEIAPDLIHVHFTTGIFTTLISRKPKATIIGMLHGMHSPTLSKPFARKVFKHIERLFFRRLDELWLLNQEDFDLVRYKKSLQKYLVTSKGLGCDLEKFNKQKFSTADISNIKTSLGIKEEIVLMYTGRFVQFKGFDIVVKSFLNLVKANTGLRLKLILAGGYDATHPSGLSDAEKEALQNCPHIAFSGYTDQTERYLAITDVFLFPSSREGVPVSIMEALAMGVPVITANTRGCNELVLPDKNGVLLSASPTPEELGQAIVELAKDEERRKRYAQYALEHRDLLSRQHFIDEQIARFKQLAER